MKQKHLFLILAAVLLASCRGDDEVLVPSTWTQVAAPAQPRSVTGFYLLNEGNMGRPQAITAATSTPKPTPT